MNAVGLQYYPPGQRIYMWSLCAAFYHISYLVVKLIFLLKAFPENTSLSIKSNEQNQGNLSSSLLTIIIIEKKNANCTYNWHFMIKLNEIIFQNNLWSQPGGVKLSLWRGCFFLCQFLIQVAGDLGPPHLGLLASLLGAHRAGHQHLGLHRLAFNEN